MVDRFSQETQTPQRFGTNFWILFHILHFRCLHLNHVDHTQKCPMVQINTLSVNREMWNVFILGLKCSFVESIIVYSIFTSYSNLTYKHYQPIKIIIQIKCILLLSLSTTKRKEKTKTNVEHVTLVSNTIGCEKRPEKWAVVWDYITDSFSWSGDRRWPDFLHQDIKVHLPVSRRYKTLYLKMLIPIPEDIINSHVKNRTTEKE